MSNFFTQKDDFFFKKLICSACNNNYFVSAWDKSRDSWANSQKLTLTKSTSIVYGVKEYHKKSYWNLTTVLICLMRKVWKKLISHNVQWLFEKKKCPILLICSSWILDLDFFHIFEPLAASLWPHSTLKAVAINPNSWLFYKRITEQITQWIIAALKCAAMVCKTGVNCW